MKNVVLFIVATVFGIAGAYATTTENLSANRTFGNGNSFIFNENGITFAVYPDGEFDFYIDNRVTIGVGARIGNVGITFNSGWDYNPFVQYDDYGAVIQVENVPIFYDYYGRVSQIGNVDVWYRNGLVRRVGGLTVFWNRGGVFSHTTGFVNVYNRYYVYRPFHRWFARPAVGFCNVWTTPYRRFYSPIRYTWHRPYRSNIRRAYAQVGQRYRFNQNRGATVYRNDRRVAVRDQRRPVRDARRSSADYTQRRTGTRANDARVNRNNNRSGRVVGRTNDNTVRNNRENSVTRRTEARTPQRSTVTKKSTTNKRSNNRAVVSNRSRGNNAAVKRSTPTERRSVSKNTQSRSNTNAARSRTRSSRLK